MNNNIKGSVIAVIAAIGYGLNPFFALPLYEEGFTVDSVLFYRFAFAIVIMGGIMLFKGQSFAIHKREIGSLIGLGALLASTTISLFESFNYIDGGIACTILFVYPVIVAIIMAIFFKERVSRLTYLCMGLALVGIYLLYDGGNQPLNLIGVGWVLMAALTYAGYVIVVNSSRLKKMDALKLTFWAAIVALFAFIVRLNILTDLQPITNLNMLYYAVGLSLVPTVGSIVLVAIAVKMIGSTYTSIVGCLEPLTALAVGIFLYDEPVTFRVICGVVIILTAVTLVVTAKSILGFLHRGENRIRRALGV